MSDYNKQEIDELRDILEAITINYLSSKFPNGCELGDMIDILMSGYFSCVFTLMHNLSSEYPDIHERVKRFVSAASELLHTLMPILQDEMSIKNVN